MKRKLVILLSVVCIGLADAQDLYTTIDVLRAGVMNFPDEVNNVLVVNNAVNQPADYGHQTRLLGQITNDVTIDIDSALIYFLTSFVSALEQEQYFGSVGLLEISQNKSGKYFEQHPLTSLQTDHLRKMYEADAVIALNRLVLTDVLEDFPTTDDDYYACLEVKCVSVWHVFLPNQTNAVPLTLADTLFWENRDFRRSDAIDGLPDRRDALLDMAIYSAQSVGRRLIPHWEQRDRYFYTHNDKQIKAGIDSLYHKQWDGAIGEWYAAYLRGNANLKARAAANMASAFEIEGDLNSAYYWATKASEHFGEGFITKDKQIQQSNLAAYAKELYLRIKEEEKLNNK